VLVFSKYPFNSDQTFSLMLNWREVLFPYNKEVYLLNIVLSYLLSLGPLLCVLWMICLAYRLFRAVRQIGAKIWWNCGICGGSAKFGTWMETCLLDGVGYGPTWEVSHNCGFNGFWVAHWISSMETRLGFCFSCSSHSPASLRATVLQKWRIT